MILAATQVGQGLPFHVQMLALGLLLLGAHLGGRLCQRFGLSEVTGHLLGGMLVGPYALHLVGVIPGEGALYGQAVKTFEFFIFVFLSVVTFAIGEELLWVRLKEFGRNAAIICLAQAIFTWVTVSFSFYLLSNLTLIECMIVGSIGIATGPAVTFVLMNKLKVEGRLRNMVGSVVVLVDLIQVIVFSFLVQMALRHDVVTLGGVLLPTFKDIVLAVLMGAAIYLSLLIFVSRKAEPIQSEEEDAEEVHFLDRILAERPSPSAEILVLVFAFISIGSALSFHWQIPFLITATTAGILVANFHSSAIFDSLRLENTASVINLVFFALIGASVSLSALETSSVLLVVLYIGARSFGKLFGTYMGCRLLKEDRKITACLPQLMLPQAGVAAVESVYASLVLNKPELTAIILPAVVFFEVVGVFLVDRSLRKWETWVPDEELVLKEELPTTGARAAAAQRVLEHTPVEAIDLHLKGKTKQEVIEELVERAIEASGQHLDKAKALQLIGERERLAPTGLGNGVAMPHCRVLGIEKPIVAIGRHEKGVVFGGVDNELCHLFVLVISPASRPGEHLKLLADVAHLLNDSEVRQSLLNAKRPEDFLNTLKNLA